MQNASSNFSAAATGSARTLAGHKLSIDWAGDGYGSGLYDDASKQIGRWSVSHHLDDGLPDQVSFVAGLGTAELSAGVGGRYVPGVGPMNAPEFWSPMRTDSPIYGIERDVPPVKLEVGFVTAGGQERVTIFTGQMTEAPVSGNGSVSMQAMSASRLALAGLVQPPGFRGRAHGANATWPVSWGLYKRGLHTSPPPRSGVRWWMPLHGSMKAFYPDDFFVYPDADTYRESPVAFDGAENFNLIVPEWQTGPYVLAADVGLQTDNHRQMGIIGIRLGEGTDLLSQAGNAGRFEFWVKGVSANTNLAPQGSGGVTKLSGIELANHVYASYVKMGVGTDRKVFVTVNDGAGHIVTLQSTDTLPTDEAWYFVGAAYDIANKKLWCTNFNGTTASTGASSLVTTSLPAGDAWSNYVDAASGFFGAPWWVTWIPTAEVHLTAGAQANVDNFPTWLNGISWTQSAIITPSSIELVGLAEPVPREAWEMIGGYAQAELAMLRTDELDRVLYLGPKWFVLDAQQVATPMIATNWNAAKLGVERDPSKIRNSVRVSFSDALETPIGQTTVYASSNAVVISPGVTILSLAFQDPAMEIYGNPFDMFTDQSFIDIPGLFLEGSITNYVTLNDQSDGAGNYCTAATQVLVEIISWNPSGALIQFSNLTSTTWYLANASSKPSLAVAGWPLVLRTGYGTDSDSASITTRGERGLAVSASALQDSVSARRLARRIKMALRKPVDVVKDVAIVGDPRRQPGDLLSVSDRQTGASGSWRIQTVDHAGDQASYHQRVTVRRSLPICIVGQGLVGQSLVGPGE